jgi:UDP-glucose 4-epimerase
MESPIVILLMGRMQKTLINPYDSTKLMIERILQDYASSYGSNSISLRYFNACGADPGGVSLEVIVSHAWAWGKKLAIRLINGYF